MSIEKLLPNETIDAFGRKYNAATEAIPVAAQPIGNGQVAIMLAGGGHFILPIPKTPNSVLSGCSVAVDGSTVTVAPGSWIIAAVEYAKATSTMLGLSPLVSQANQRIDLVLSNQSSTFEILEGVEAASPARPNVPVNKLEVGFILLTGSGATVEQPAGIKNLSECGDVFIESTPTEDNIFLGWSKQLGKWVAKMVPAGTDFAPADSDNADGFWAGLINAGKVAIAAAFDRVAERVKLLFPAGDGNSFWASDGTFKAVPGAYTDTQARAALSGTAPVSYNSTSGAIGLNIDPAEFQLTGVNLGIKAVAASKVTGLGNAATRNVGTTAGTLSAGDDSRLSDHRPAADGELANVTLAGSTYTVPLSSGMNTFAEIDVNGAFIIGLSGLPAVGKVKMLSLTINKTVNTTVTGTLPGGARVEGGGSTLSLSAPETTARFETVVKIWNVAGTLKYSWTLSQPFT